VNQIDDVCPAALCSRHRKETAIFVLHSMGGHNRNAVFVAATRQHAGKTCACLGAPAATSTTRLPATTFAAFARVQGFCRAL
jgi:hypothetical protein